MEPGTVDLTCGEDPDADLRGTCGYGPEEALAILGRDLLRVVQQRERADAVAAKRGVVEEDAGNDERACERSAPSLVRACDEAHSEPSIVCEEPLAAGPSHAAEDSR